MALQKLLLELEFAVPGASADVVQDDVGHQREQEAHKGVLQDDDRLVAEHALGEALDRGDEHVAAVEHGNDDPGQQRYELSFGGRRAFCKEKYFDLDDVEASGGEGANAGFDELLRRARGRN